MCDMRGNDAKTPKIPSLIILFPIQMAITGDIHRVQTHCFRSKTLQMSPLSVPVNSCFAKLFENPQVPSQSGKSVSACNDPRLPRVHKALSFGYVHLVCITPPLHRTASLQTCCERQRTSRPYHHQFCAMSLRPT